MLSLKGYNINTFLVNLNTLEINLSVFFDEDDLSSKVGSGRFGCFFISSNS